MLSLNDLRVQLTHDVIDRHAEDDRGSDKKEYLISTGVIFCAISRNYTLWHSKFLYITMYS